MNRYLGPDPARMIQQIRERAPEWFTLADDVASFCSDLLPDIEAGVNDGQQVLSAVLFRRGLSAFEAVLLLAERGMHTEGLVRRRSMLEALFVLGAIWRQPDLVRTYVQNDQHRRRDIYKNLRKSSPDSRRGLTAWITDEEPTCLSSSSLRPRNSTTFTSRTTAFYPRLRTTWRATSNGRSTSAKTMRSNR